MSVKAQELLTKAGACFDDGDWSGAAVLYRDVLEQQPEQPQALMMLGLIARQMGRLELSLQLMETAIAVAPQVAAMHINYAVILRQMDRRAEARAAAEKALQLEPQSADALDTAGYMAREDGDVVLALERHQQAVKYAPQNARMQANYAVALLRAMKLPEAFNVATEALCLDPQLAQAHMTMATILRAAGYPARAIPYFQKTQALQPDYIDAYTNEAQAQMLVGDWTAGWRGFEKRFYNDKRFAHLPRWQGEKTGHLLVHVEQGFGDALQFLRFVSLIKDRVAQISLQVPQPLLRLVTAALPDVKLLTPEETVPAVDAHVPLMSLPHILNTNLETVPSPLQVIADEADRHEWRNRLQNVTQPRIGIVSSGNPLHPNDHNRSVSSKTIEPLLNKFGQHCVMMQADSSFSFQGQSIGKPKDFADTAALLAELDLVITVDTSLAHLVGTMGRPTWLLLPFDPDWRWLYEREDSVWYPSLRLFRQTQLQDWPSVVARVMSELDRFIAGDKIVLEPKKWLRSLVLEHPQALPLAEKP